MRHLVPAGRVAPGLGPPRSRSTFRRALQLRRAYSPLHLFLADELWYRFQCCLVPEGIVWLLQCHCDSYVEVSISVMVDWRSLHTSRRVIHSPVCVKHVFI